MEQDTKTQEQKQVHPLVMLPECASSFATLTVQMSQITKSQEALIQTQSKLVEKIKGNGIVGLEDLIADSQRSIKTLTQLVNTLVASKEEDIKLLKAEKREREEQVRLTANLLAQSDETRKTELLKANEARRLEARKFIYGIVSAIIIVVVTGAWGIYQNYANQKILMMLATGQ